jgi:hypothetical protein
MAWTPPTTPAEAVAMLRDLVRRHREAVQELLGKPEFADLLASHEVDIERLQHNIAVVEEANGLGSK